MATGIGQTTANAAQAQGSLLLTQAEGDAGSRQNAKIEKAGKDFESILLGGWLQGAEKSFAAAPGSDGDDGDQDAGQGQWMGMAMQQLATTLVASGGIGIARMISEHLQQVSAESGKPAAGIVSRFATLSPKHKS
jgi:Rod binding domain-containing protein